MSVFTIKNELIIDNPTNAMRKWCRDNLTIPNPQYAKAEEKGKWTGNIAKTLQMYYTVGSQLRLPFGIARKFYKLFKNDVSQINALFAPIRRKTYNSSISLREYQKNAVEAALKARNGVLVSPCGSGKSEMGLEIAARISGRTLWIVHTWDLANQILNRAAIRYNIPKESYGQIAAGKVNIGDVFTVATVQTLSRIDLSKIQNEFDCIIVDECQHVCSSADKVTQFEKVITSLCSPYLYGITATPYRADGLERCMFALLGDVIHEVPQSAVAGNTVPVKVKFVNTGYTPDIDDITDGDGTLNYAKLISDITDNKDRNAVIVGEIQRAAQNGGVLVLSDRLQHLDVMEKRLCAIFPYRTARLGIASTKAEKERRARILTDLNNGLLNVVFATYKLAKEGLDVPNLCTVVLACPVKDKTTVIQSAGRVARKADDKDFGTVIDFSDDFGLLYGYEKKRRGYYKKNFYIFI